MTQDPKDLRDQRTRSAPLSIKTFPQFKEALVEYTETHGHASITGFVLKTLADKIGWNGPT